MKRDYDVVIIGGGTAGSVAALAAARQGVKVLLVEFGANLGGLAAIGMTWGGFFDNNYKRIIGGIPHELVEKSVKIGGRGYFEYHGSDKWITSLASVDPEAIRYVLEDELYQAGCDIMLFSALSEVMFDNGSIQSVIITSKISKIECSAKIFIDATGDATLADMIGVKWEHASENLSQCVSNMFRICNVDMKEYEKFLQEHINTEGKDPWRTETGTIRRGIGYWCPWKHDGFENMPKSLGIYFHGKQGDVILNCTSASINPLDIFELSRANYELRKEAFHVLDYLKGKVPAFKNSYISQIYDVGVREGRRIIGDTTITLDDIVNHNPFNDKIGMGAYPPDIHYPDGEVHISSTSKWKEDSDGAYDIPISCMTAAQCSNLMVVGRCISATFEAQSALRGIGPCMVEGEGAGTAAAQFVDSDLKDIRDINIINLQSTLKNNGVILG